MALGMLFMAAQPVGAATLKFGAKLSAGIQPSNSPSTCDHQLNGGSGTYACTWILNQAYNGGLVTAPANGKINKVKLISCHAGSFTVQLAQKSGSSFKIVTQGPKVTYTSQCNGYPVQKYSITPMTVHTGEYLAVKGSGSMGPIRCDSGSPRTYLFKPPLVVGGGFTAPTDDTGCFLLVQFVYSV